MSRCRMAAEPSIRIAGRLSRRQRRVFAASGAATDPRSMSRT